MKTFYTTCIFLFISIISFNLFVDKKFFWHRHSSFDQQNLKNGDCLKLTGEKLTGTDRLSQRKIRKDMAKPDIVVFSSSRGAYSEQSLFPHKIIYNSATSIALLEDHIDAWRDLVKQNKVPSEAIIFIDGWIFNEAINQFRSWDSIPGFLDFLKEHKMFEQLPKFQAKRYQRENLNRLKLAILDLISFSQTQISLELLLNGEFNKFEVKSCKNIHDDFVYMYWNGAHFSSRKMSDEDLIKTVSEERSGLSYLEPWQKNSFMIEVFNLIVRDMINHNVKVHIVTPLTHPISLSLITKKDGVVDSQKIISDLKNKFSDINVCDVYDANAVPCGKFEFKDGIHMTKGCTEKLLKYCGIIK